MIKVDLSRAPVQERYQHLLTVIGSGRFLRKQGLGNEVPFFICPYKPEEAIEMERLQRQLINKLAQNGIEVLAINLYDLAVQILKKEGDWDWCMEEEKSISKEELKEELQSMLDVETVLTPAIKEKMNGSEYQVIFISGVGEVFPYIRSHNVLNNLQKTAKEKPTVMFFPGEYTHSLETGASLDLFGRLHDDKYYRAFNIYHSEV
jgi:glutamate synthase domain-containing protein 1